MNNDIYLYYCLNQTNQTVKTSKEGLKTINIVYIPEHISLRILHNELTPDGLIVPTEEKEVVFKQGQKDIYELIYSLLFPKVNYASALSHVEYPVKTIRNISIAIIHHTTNQLEFDDWLELDSTGYTCLR